MDSEVWRGERERVQTDGCRASGWNLGELSVGVGMAGELLVHVEERGSQIFNQVS